MTTHEPGVCECVTCGYPCLRPEGHAAWCAALNNMTLREGIEAAVSMAERTGNHNIDNDRHWRPTGERWCACGFDGTTAAGLAAHQRGAQCAATRTRSAS